MKHRKLGNIDVSVIGLGCNNFGMRLDEADTAKVVHAALDAGVNFFDTADVYGNGLSEEYLGKALKGQRDDVVIATKFGAYDVPETLTGGHPEWIKKAVDNSLRRLGADWIDLYQHHFPDAKVPVADTLGALNDLVVAGKVRHIGCSNYGADLLGESNEVSNDRGFARFASVQNRFSVLHSEPLPDVIPACEELGLAFLPYFPLESGLLTGKVTPQGPPEGSRLAAMPEERKEMFLADWQLDRTRVLTSYASNHGRSILELAFGYLLAHAPVSSVIAGATRVDQIVANAAADGWEMTPDELGEISEIVKV
ncbi:MAG: aldo/keto reductase [Acidimicrobiales bacterium]|nr:aldo/keto reductase [Acidimicrobiales bacterium]